MREVTLYVAPAEGGWGVECDLPIESAYFPSGGQAERAARSLAVKLSSAGHDVRLSIRDRARRLIATHHYDAA